MLIQRHEVDLLRGKAKIAHVAHYGSVVAFVVKFLNLHVDEANEFFCCVTGCENRQIFLREIVNKPRVWTIIASGT
jgi:hypothetical protein